MNPITVASIAIIVFYIFSMLDNMRTIADPEYLALQRRRTDGMTPWAKFVGLVIACIISCLVPIMVLVNS